MDETDVKILQQILSDARLSYRKIGEKIGVSPPTVTFKSAKAGEESYYKIVFRRPRS